ncbi:hypothetical protein J1N35_005483 [Gossypium stocksii]|uniref:Uncharacterized protein n=1 Tax=Gossypium stocksii TaxID=47602 RepID=A0A9D3WEL7_9ROSI|nr:hypothetical protein J1N35_005483 [Gossypium stocksii]
MQEESPGLQEREWQNGTDALRQDVRALHPESQDMDWLFCSNNLLALEIALVSLPLDFKFGNDDEELVCNKEANDPMVVSATISGYKVKRILVDNGSVVEVLTWEAYQNMGLKGYVLSKDGSLYGFVNHSVQVKGSTSLPVTL